MHWPLRSVNELQASCCRCCCRRCSCMLTVALVVGDDDRRARDDVVQAALLLHLPDCLGQCRDGCPSLPGIIGVVVGERVVESIHPEGVAKWWTAHTHETQRTRASQPLHCAALCPRSGQEVVAWEAREMVHAASPGCSCAHTRRKTAQRGERFHSVECVSPGFD